MPNSRCSGTSASHNRSTSSRSGYITYPESTRQRPSTGHLPTANREPSSPPHQQHGSSVPTAAAVAAATPVPKTQPIDNHLHAANREPSSLSNSERRSSEPAIAATAAPNATQQSQQQRNGSRNCRKPSNTRNSKRKALQVAVCNRTALRVAVQRAQSPEPKLPAQARACAPRPASASDDHISNLASEMFSASVEQHPPTTP